MSRPNILVIFADQLRRQALSCYGDKNISTPNIDALANEGFRMDAACSSYPICVPFRFTMITGQYAHSRLVPGIDWRMSPAERTFADDFNDAGYHTVYVGKWHLYGGHGPSMFNRPVPRQYQGRFQKWFGFEFRNSFFDTCYFEDDDPTPIPIHGYQTDGLFDRTIDYLTVQHDREKPFCCVLSVEAPHPPFEAPQEYEKQWIGREIELRPNFLKADHHNTEQNVRQCEGPDERLLRDHRIYYAMIQNLDDNIGRMMAALKQAKLDENTIVLFFADHGELMGSHCLRAKQFPYEESCGIPLIAWGPSCGIAAGDSGEPVATEDLMPTICGLAGIKPREQLPGMDASPLFRRELDALDRDGVMLEFVAELRSRMPLFNQPWRGFRSRRYKYTVQQRGDQGMQPWQFFDLQRDPYELENLVNDPESQQLVASHHAMLRRRMEETSDHAWLAAAHGMPALNRWIPRGEIHSRSHP